MYFRRPEPKAACFKTKLYAWAIVFIDSDIKNMDKIRSNEIQILIHLHGKESQNSRTLHEIWLFHITLLLLSKHIQSTSTNIQNYLLH